MDDDTYIIALDLMTLLVRYKVTIAVEGGSRGTGGEFASYSATAIAENSATKLTATESAWGNASDVAGVREEAARGAIKKLLRQAQAIEGVK